MVQKGLTRLAVVTDHVLVAAGAAALLTPFRRRLHVRVVLDEAIPSERFDVALVDVDEISASRLLGRIDEIVASTSARVLSYSWAPAMSWDASTTPSPVVGHLPKAATGEEILTTVLDVRAGRFDRPPDGSPYSSWDRTPSWPTMGVGLSEQEFRVLSLIATGLSNQEIATSLFLSINSIKTYIRAAYRKIGVTNRSQALLWAVEHGLNPRHPTRTPAGRSGSQHLSDLRDQDVPQRRGATQLH